MTDLHHHPRENIGGYVLERCLGSGASATVYLARSAIGKEVALKLLTWGDGLGERFSGTEIPGRKRLCAEAMSLAKLGMPGIAHVLDLGVDDNNQAFLVTEYIPGFTLEQDVLQHGSWIREDALELGKLLADTLTAVHARGVCHRDIKPANVILGPDGPVLIDFGISFMSDAPRLTQTGLVVGTPGFISPEVINGKTPDFSDDWWSLGSTLLFALTGRPPFGTGTQTVQIARVLAGNPDTEGLDKKLGGVFRQFLSPSETQKDDFNAVLSALEISSEADFSQVQLCDDWCTPDDSMPTMQVVQPSGMVISLEEDSTDSSQGNTKELPQEWNDLIESEKKERTDDGAENEQKIPVGSLPFTGLTVGLAWGTWVPDKEIIAGIVLGVALCLFGVWGWYSRAKRKVLSLPAALFKGMFSAIPGTLVVVLGLLGSYEIGSGLFDSFLSRYPMYLDLIVTSVPTIWVLQVGLVCTGLVVAWWLPNSAPVRAGARGLTRNLFPQWWQRLVMDLLILVWVSISLILL